MYNPTFAVHISYRLESPTSRFDIPATQYCALNNLLRLSGISKLLDPGQILTHVECMEIRECLKKLQARPYLPSHNSEKAINAFAPKELIKADLSYFRNELNQCPRLFSVLIMRFKFGPMEVQILDGDCYWKWNGETFDLIGGKYSIVKIVK
jgi:hypothetical protein